MKTMARDESAFLVDVSDFRQVLTMPKKKKKKKQCQTSHYYILLSLNLCFAFSSFHLLVVVFLTLFFVRLVKCPLSRV